MGKLQDRYYSDYILKENPTTLEEEIVFAIIEDFTDRRGLRQEWECIGNDIKEEILETWISIVKDKLNKRI
jgi:hypothetical protein